MTDRVRRLAAPLAIVLVLVACTPAPIGQVSPSPAPTSAASEPPSPTPAPTGPTPRPTFIRPTPTPLPTFLAYVVRSGDTLSAIARMFRTTALSIAVWNRDQYPSLDPESEGYQPDRIEVGWILRIIPDAVIDEDDLLEPTPTPGGTTGPAPSSGSSPAPTARPTAGAAAIVVRNGDRASTQVALTFDMGGRLDPAVDILQWLVDHEIDATIFPTGKTGTTTAEGRAALDLVSRHRDRFDLGNHSWSHPDFRDLDDAAMRDQLLRTEAGVVEAIGMSTRPWFRPPFGGLDEQIPAVVGSAGWSHIVMWDIDTIDWRPEDDGGPTAQAIVDKVVERARGGSIVLMHLGGFNTLQALPGIVAGLRAKGLEPVTLGEMFGA
jgi:peptidoglycan/xylan/chitin deacetylase (PgdA/CDA1 family)